MDPIAQIEALRCGLRQRGMIFAIDTQACPSEMQSTGAHVSPFRRLTLPNELSYAFKISVGAREPADDMTSRKHDHFRQ